MYLLAFRIHDEVYISLTVTDICIGQSMDTSPEESEDSWREVSSATCMDGNLTCLCTESTSPSTPTDITDIQIS